MSPNGMIDMAAAGLAQATAAAMIWQAVTWPQGVDTPSGPC